MYVVGVVALALAGCGLDRTGLQNVLGSGDGGNPGKGDAAADRIGGGAGGSGGGGGSIVGTGGDSGAGGGIIVDGSGGIIGAGGRGGMIGAGGMIMGTGGKIAGAGGLTFGTGGTIVGTGGIPGIGGVIMGAGGTIVGTGGSTDGGTEAETGGAGTDGGGLGGNPGGLGGGPGTGGAGTGGMGAPGLGGSGGATICTPACGPCQQCGANHTCEVDPASFWDLSAVLASINPKDPNVKPPNTSDWDVASGEEIGGSLPDPFVELDFLSTAITPIGHTVTIPDTLLANWGALISPSAALLNPMGAPVRASDLMAGGKNWQISVFDEDADTAIGPFGETVCNIDGPLTSADFLNGSFTRTDVYGCFSVSIKLTCHP